MESDEGAEFLGELHETDNDLADVDNIVKILSKSTVSGHDNF